MMASELLALLAAGGLMAAGANPAAETRAAQALPAGKFVAVAAPAKGPVGRCLVKPGKLAGKPSIVCGKQNAVPPVGGIFGGIGGLAGGIGPVVVTGLVVAGGVAVGVAVANQQNAPKCVGPGA